MGRDNAAWQAANFLLASEVAGGLDREDGLTAFRDRIKGLTFVPLVTTARPEPLSTSPEDALARISGVDPTADAAVAAAFLAYEEDVRDAVHLVRRAGFRDHELLREILARGRGLTTLFLRQGEALLAAAGDGWTARRFMAALSRAKPTYPELVELLQLAPEPFAAQMETRDRKRD